MEQTVHKLILEGRYIVFHTGFLQRLVHQLSERFGTLMGIYRTLTNRHLAIHIVLERSGSLDRSGTIQLIVQSAGVSVDIVILDIRQTNEIPVFLVVARDLVIHVRYYHLRIFLVRIYRSRSIISTKRAGEVDGVSGANLDIELEIAYSIDSLCRNIMRFRLTFLEFALSVFLIDSVFLEEVSLRQQTFVNSHFDGRLTGACILSDDVQRLIEERLICFQISGLHLIPHLGISALTIRLTHTDRQCVISAVTAERFYQLSTELEVSRTGWTGNANNNGIFLGVGFCSYDLLKRTCRNSIGIMLTGFQFLTLGHHLLHDRESVSSLSLDGILGRTKVYQVSYRFKLLICITNFINLLFRNDIPCGIYILLIEAIPFQRNQRQALSCDGIERLYRQDLSPEANGGSALEVYEYHAVLQYIKGTVLYRNLTLGTGSQREVLNRRSLFYRAGEYQLSYALTGFILAVLDMETDVVATLHHLAQVNSVPQVSVSCLDISGNPVERNSGSTTCTLSLLGQTDLQFNRLRRNHAYINGILYDILEHVTRDLTAV